MAPVLDLLIRNATVACPGGVFRGAVGVRDGRIAVLCDGSWLPQATERIDARGALLLPGGIDTHVHLREPACPERGGFATETAAAAAGGVTTILEMPISAPPQYSAAILKNRIDIASRASLVDFGFYGGAGAEHIDRIPELAAAGVVGRANNVPADLPKVTLAKNGKPSIDMNGYKGSDSLVSQDLIKGKGAVVKDTQSVMAHYTGWLLDGTQFDSSWDRGQSSAFSLDSVIKGWKQGLAGHTVGSQVLLVVPPSLGYGNKDQEKIPANSTLVFVVDILAAY